MVAPPVRPEVSRRMSATSGKDNPRERSIRSRLHRQGLRFRIHYRVPELPRRTIDIAFPTVRLAVFCDGCFWHGCPEHATTPKSNTAWWQEKIAMNIERDADTDLRLRAAGWRVLRLWEHVPEDEAVGLIRGALWPR